MPRPAHTIMLQPWRGLSFGERVVIDATTAMLWPLTADDRMTVLLNLMAAQIDSMIETDDQIADRIGKVGRRLRSGGAS